MVYFRNLNYDQFIAMYSDRQVICIGAGGTFQDFLKNHRGKVYLLEQITRVLDNDPQKTGGLVAVDRRELRVEYLPAFLKQCEEKTASSTVFLLLLQDKYIPEVLRQLDQVPALQDAVCLYGLYALNWGYERFTVPTPVFPTLPEPRQNHQIPKKIHYCWFGEREMSALNRECIESWKRTCPDYEIVLWSEKNFDLANAPAYVREAYAAKKYPFVSDFVRLEVVFRCGGFYLDTDVELFRSLDNFRPYRAVYAFMEYGQINTGLGFGSVAGAPELAEQIALYEKVPFRFADGNCNLTPCPEYADDYFRRIGVRLDNALQMYEDILYLPSSYLCPLNPILCEDGCYNLALYAPMENTYAIHKCENTWRDGAGLEAFDKKKAAYRQINARLVQDWKRTVLKS